MKAKFFYAENGMLSSTDPGWLHTVFDTLTALFEQVVLGENVKKTVGMVYHLYWAAEVRAYKS